MKTLNMTAFKLGNQQEFDELLEYHVAEAKKEMKFHLNGIIGMFKRQREKDLKLMAKNRKR